MRSAEVEASSPAEDKSAAVENSLENAEGMEKDEDQADEKGEY